MDWMIRRTEPRDYRATEALTREAFWDRYRPGCTEHLVVRQIRASGDYLPDLDYVAEEGGRIVGHILYSRSRLVDGAGHGTELVTFGPISVSPEVQGQGVGSQLIEQTKALASAMGYPGIAIYGSPAYYGRFGFESAEKYGITTPDGKNFDAFMVLPLATGSLSGLHGRLYTSPAFETAPEDVERFDADFPRREMRFSAPENR